MVNSGLHGIRNADHVARASRDPNSSTRTMEASCGCRHPDTWNVIPLTFRYSVLSKGSSTNASSSHVPPYLPIGADPSPEVPSTNELGSVAENLAASSAKIVYVDPLADLAACARDIPYLQDLQTNVIRTYGIDPSRSHSACMALLANAGIFVITDLVAPGYTISNVNPVWNSVLYDRYAAVIDAMHNYTNLLGFIVGDDVVNGIGTNDSGPYVKAAVRDMKAYLRQKDYRSIPVGYVNSVLQGTAVAQISTSAKDIWEYLNCGDNGDSIDFWGANIVDWCKGSTYTDSGYANATSELSAYSVPVFLAAYGCSIPFQRDFSEISAIYGQQMSPIWSGGIIYEYFSQSNPGYGKLVVRTKESYLS